MASIPVIAGVGTVIAALIAIYRFFIRRPALSFHVRPMDDMREGGLVPLFFSIRNSGRRYAEEPYVMFRPDGWEFAFRNPDNTDSLFESVDFNWQMVPPNDADFSDEWNQTHQIHLSAPVYRSFEHIITMRFAEFEPGEDYEFGYYIACKGHPPRVGVIGISISPDGSVSVESEEPTFWNRIRDRIMFSLDRLASR